MDNIENAMKELRKGGVILIHDSDGRENETDMVIAAEFVNAENISKMRMDGGGLICLAIEGEIAEKLGLPFVSDLMDLCSKEFPILDQLKADDIPYDEKSSFSITINHRKTFTGITDNDRALTIREFGLFGKELPNDAEEARKGLGDRFRSPGHIPLLISSGLGKREGHTELSTALLKMANLTPLAAICEMMDDQTHKALSSEKALEYAESNHLIFLEANEIKDNWKKWQE